MEALSEKKIPHRCLLTWMFHGKSLKISLISYLISPSKHTKHLIFVHILCLMKTGVSSVFLRCLNEVNRKCLLQLKRQCVWENRVKFFKDDERWLPSLKGLVFWMKKLLLQCCWRFSRLYQCQEYSQEPSGCWWYSTYRKGLLLLSKPSSVWWLNRGWWNLIDRGSDFRFSMLLRISYVLLGHW